jgi:phosphate-selective porin
VAGDRAQLLQVLDNLISNAIRYGRADGRLAQPQRPRRQRRDARPPNYINGGKQLDYELSLIWNPIDDIRFQAQYARGSYEGGPRVTTVAPGATAPANARSFGVDTVALRAQVEI